MELYMCCAQSLSRALLFATPRTVAHQATVSSVHGIPTRLLCPWDSPGKDTGVGCRSLLQGIFPTLGSNPGLLHCRQLLYHLSHREAQNFTYSQTQGSPNPASKYPLPEG